MKPTTENLYALAMELPPAERVTLPERLCDSLGDAPLEGDEGWASPQIRQAWIEECERRLKAYEHGEMESFDAEYVFREFREGGPR
jgi:hypothetical protein